MPVIPVYSPGLGEALAQGAQNFMAARRQKHLSDQQDQLFQRQMADALYAQARQRASDEMSGLHITAPGELLPTSVTSQAIESLNPNPTTAPGLPKSRAGAGALLIPGHPAAGVSQAGAPSALNTGQPSMPGVRDPVPSAAPQSSAPMSFQDQMAQALAAMGATPPAPLPRYQVGTGYYLDRQPAQQQVATARAQHMQDVLAPAFLKLFTAQQTRSEQVQRLVDAGMPRARAEVEVDHPNVLQNDSLFAKPTPDPVAIHAKERDYDNAHPSPQQPTIQVLPGAGGKPPQAVYLPKNPDGQITTRDIPNVVKEVPGSSVSSLAIPNYARILAAVPTMQAQNKVMVDFENRTAADPSLFTGLDEFKRAFYKMPTDMDINAATQSAMAQSNLNKNNPALARYIRAGMRFAFEDGTIQQRGGTDQRRAADEFISTIGPGMDAATIKDTQEGRATRINGYASILPSIKSRLENAEGGAQAAPATSAPSGNIDLRTPSEKQPVLKQRITRDQANFLRTVKHMTDAQIAASYKVTP